MKSSLTWLFSIVFAFCSFSQNKYAKIDGIARSIIPKENATSTKSIAKYLVSHASSEEEKARILFVYVTAIINYDIKRSGKKVDPMWTINNRKGVCEHYAQLYEALCKQVGINCVFVDGYCKYYEGFRPFQFPRKKLHAWNAVQIDKKWYLVDPTWADGGNKLVQTSKNKAVNKMIFHEEYWLADPKEMIKNHWPALPRWQLLNSVVPYKQFRKNTKNIESKKNLIENYNFNDTISKYNKIKPDDRDLENAKDRYRNDPHGKTPVHFVIKAYFDKVEKLVKKKNPSSEDYKQALAYLKACRPYTHGSPIKKIKFGKIRRQIALNKLACRINK